MAKVFSGQPWKPPKAAQQNRWDESAEFWELKKRLRDKLPDQRMPVPTELDVIKVKNSTGGDRNESEVVELSLDEVITEPTRLHPWMTAIEMTSRCARYGVLRYAMKEDDIRWCQVSGPTFALVDLTDGNKRCSPKEGFFHFIGDDDGPVEIIWRPDETSGVHECLVEMEQVVPPTTYIARIPTEGFPPRVGLVPGRAICKIYRLDPHDYNDPEEKTLVVVTKAGGGDLTKEIYNPTLTEIPENDGDLYVPIHREECGNWIVQPETRPAEMIRFEIDSVDLEAMTALVNITSRTCPLLVVTGEVDGQVTVHDPCECFLDESEEALVGRCGTAVFMLPDGAEDCQWEIWHLCCPPT